MEKEILHFANIVTNLQSFVIISHNKPDGDTLGANLALSKALIKMGKTVCSACADLPPKSAKFLYNSQEIKSDFLLEDYDCVIVVDTGAKHLVRFFEMYPELNRTRKPIICIDHHFSSSPFGTLNIIDPDETSTTTLLYKIFTMLNWNIDKDIATALLNGLYTDTGSFKHANTKRENFQIAKNLLKKGANLKAIIKNNFQSQPSNKLKLLGEALNNLSINDENVATIGVPKSLLEKFNAEIDDLSGLSDLIAGIKEANYSCLLTEDNGKIKASLRTNKNINVAEIAEKHGGGGHIKAAGYKIPGKLQKNITWQVI